MRKITQEASRAFWAWVEFKKDNTEVVITGNINLLFLHWNKIAVWDKFKKELFITNAGWQTTTTKERLNGILARLWKGISQKNFAWYIDGEELDFERHWYGGRYFKTITL